MGSRSDGGGSELGALVGTVEDWATNDAGMVDNDWVGGRLLSDVLADMGHGDIVEGDATDMTLTVVVGIPGLDITLLHLGETTQGHRSNALASEVGRSLHHVARSAAIVGAGTIAVLGNGRVAMRGVQTNAASAVH